MNRGKQKRIMSAAKPVVLFLSGGVSAEWQIALLSAQNVDPHLDRKNFTVLAVFVAPNGQWYLLPEGQDWTELRQWDTLQSGAFVQVRLLPTAGGLRLQVGQEYHDIALIFPMMHGPGGEDGAIQGLAQFFGVPVVGSDLGGSAINMDKLLMKGILAQQGIPCPRYRSFCAHELGVDGPSGAAKQQDYRQLAEELFATWGCASLYVKPARMGSSVGMSQVRAAAELAAAIKLALEYDGKLLIEEGLCALELEFAAMELAAQGALHISTAAQIHSRGEFYSYEQKYFADKLPRALKVEARNDLSAPVLRRAQELARRSFLALDVRHYARIDLFYLETEDRLLCNEINTIPGFTAHSMFPLLMQQEGWPLDRLIPHLLQLALHGGENKS